MADQLYIGVNIGVSSVKSVLMSRRKEQWFFHKFRIIEIDGGEDGEDPEAGVSDALKAALEGFDTSGAKVICSLDDKDIFSLSLLMPRIPKDELKEAVLWEAKNQLPVTFKDVVLDYKLQEEIKEGETKKQRFIVSLGRASVIKKALGIFERLGVRVAAVIPAAVAIEKFLVTFEKQLISQSVAIIDIGENLSDVYIYDKAQLQFSRRLPASAKGICESLMTPLVGKNGKVELSLSEARQLLKAVGIPDEEGPQEIGGKLTRVQVLSLVRPHVEKLSNEVRRSFDFYRESFGKDVERILLIGGAAHLKGLVPYLSKELGLPVDIGDFREKISRDDEAKKEEDITHRLCVAFGAALSGGEGNNLIPSEEKVRTKRSVQKKALIGVLTVVICLLLGGALHLRRQINATLIEQQKLRAEAILLSGELNGYTQQLEALPLLMSAPAWEQVLRALSLLISDEIYVKELTMEEGALRITGRITKSAQNAEKVLSDFMLKLESGIFNNVHLVSSKKTETTPVETEFVLTSEIDGP